MTKKLIILLAAIGMIMPQMASAYDFEVDGIYYNTSGSDATVTYFTRTVGRSTQTTDSYSGIVVIPATVTYNDVTYNVTSIGKNAFYVCPRLTSVTIPNSVTNIEVGAFRGCSGLTSVTVESGNTHYDSRDNCNAIIETSSNTLIVGCKNTIIPNSVTSIGQSAFSGCSGLTSITIPNSVTSIGYDAFFGCYRLTSITIPNSVTSIGQSAFSGCSGLTSITIGNSVTSIGMAAFSGCSGLTSITIGNSVKWIERSAFSDCSGLTSVAIPNSVTSIGQSAFSGCSGLTSITIGNSVTSIGMTAFSGCISLTSITIPNSVTSIGMAAFSGCVNLKCVNIEDIASWCAIIFGSFFDDLHLFIDGKEIKELIIPSSVTSIGNGAFAGCRGLTSITIPNSVTRIGSSAFSGCSGLTSITIPNSVTSIGSSAFSGCNAIKEVYARPLVPPTYGDMTFNDNVCTTATLYVPNTNNCFTRYSGKEGWNNFRNIVEYDMSLLDEDPDGKPCATPTIAYKDGKLVFNSTTSGAEYHSNITAQDVGTGITTGSELKLAATYDISVYATAEGCARSASAYATLAFNLDGGGTEEEGIISVKASPVLINAEGGTLYVSGLTNATEVEYFTLEGRALGRSMVTDGCTMFTTDQPKGSTLIVTVNGRGAKVVVR